MSSTLQISLIIVGLMSVWVALVRAPVWFCRSLHRHRLWRERDAVADDILSGRLPRQHPAVSELLAVADWSARQGHKHTVTEMFLWRAVHRRVDESTPEVLAIPLDDLDEDQLALLHQHRDRIILLTTSSMLLGSWLGILTILRFVVPARRAMRTAEIEPRRGDLRATLAEATSEASQQTGIGHAAREFINLQKRNRGHHATA